MNGCMCDDDTCNWAAFGGHLGVLQWLRVNSFPWDEQAKLLRIAAQQGQEAVVWALIDAGADVNIAVDGLTPLSVSMLPDSNVSRTKRAAIVQILKDAGAR